MASSEQDSVERENSLDEKNSLKHFKAHHDPHLIAKRLANGPESVFIKDFVYGAVDGAITTFAIVAGVAGAGRTAGELNIA